MLRFQEQRMKKNRKLLLGQDTYRNQFYVIDRRGIESVTNTNAHGETYQTYPEENMLYRGNFMECVGYLKLFKKGYIA